jgi:integrating conjugative element protein (TIGR03758 family)
MTPTADQLTAFTANAGFAPNTAANFLLSAVFVTLLLWGVWALRTAYVGWAEDQISFRQFAGVLIRFAALYLALSFLLLS